MLSVVAAALSVALLPASAIAQDEPAPKASEKKICRRVVATGSVMARKTCHTKAEWDAMSARGQADAQRQINQERLRDQVQSSR